MDNKESIVMSNKENFKEKFLELMSQQAMLLNNEVIDSGESDKDDVIISEEQPLTDQDLQEQLKQKLKVKLQEKNAQTKAKEEKMVAIDIVQTDSTQTLETSLPEFRFNKEDLVQDKSIISEDTRIEGMIQTKGHLDLHGHLKGELKAIGDIKIYGSIEGNVNAIGKVELLSQAKIEGALNASELITKQGAKLSGLVCIR